MVACNSHSSLGAENKMDGNKKKVYIIFSIDTEHDLAANYSTLTAGWTKGIPWLCESFDALGIKGKVCWLIEYNLKEGIPAGNPNSKYFVKELPELIERIKTRGDELGIHPTMYDWIGKEQQVTVASYVDNDSWDMERSYHDPEFVMDLITSATKAVKAISGVDPVGCRTGAFHYATCLVTALEKNGIILDSSIFKGPKQFVPVPNAYYASKEDIRRKSTLKTGVLEIPTIGFMKLNIKNLLMRIRAEYLLRLNHPIFLSIMIHNWDVITSNGAKNDYFLKKLNSFISLFRKRGACFLSWMEAKQTFDAIYGTK